jgi:probable rRNA maturation factor
MSDDPEPGGSSPAVFISNRQAAPIPERALVNVARATLRAEGLESAELSISLVEEAEIEDLHMRYMDEAGPTDVLSFPLDDGDGGEDSVRILGDVVIAPSVAARNNPDDPDGELRLLLVHGILHLLGFDHQSDEQRAEMWARQERYSGVTIA